MDLQQIIRRSSAAGSLRAHGPHPSDASRGPSPRSPEERAHREKPVRVVTWPARARVLPLLLTVLTVPVSAPAGRAQQAPVPVKEGHVSPEPLTARVPENQFSFRHLTIDDGLSQNTVKAIVQDDRGFMWFGTKDGLNRYDGYTFVVFRYDPSDSTSISSNDVTSLLVDRRDGLWVGTRDGGLNRFDAARQTFRRYPHGPTHPITSIQEDLEGNLWIGTDGGGLYRLPDEESERHRPAFDRFTRDPKDPDGLSHDRVYALLVDRHGTLWIGTENGLSQLARPGAPAPAARFIHYEADSSASNGLIDRRISALHEDSRGRLWMGSVPGLSVFDARREHVTHHYHRYRSHRYGWGQVIDLLEDRTGQILVSTHSELMRFDPEAETFTYFRHDPLDLAGINSNSPTALYRDLSGVLWIGTNGFGINVHDPKTARFRTFRPSEDRGYRQPGFSVYTLYEDGEGRIWIDAGVLYRWDRRTGEFWSFETTPERPDDFGNTGAWSILEDPPGFLWAGTYQGLYHYEIATGRYRQYEHTPDAPDGLPEKEVYGVHRARGGSLWVVTENYLARLLDPESGHFLAYRYNDPPTSGRWTFPSTYEDADGVFWLGSNQGLIRFDPETETFRRYRHDPRRSTSLSHDVVRTVHPDPHQPEKYLWVGTAGGGLDRLDLESETFVHHTVADGLPNNVVYGILADDAGDLWMSTNQGLSRFDPRTGRFRNYDAGDGLQSSEFNSGAYFGSSGGELFFGGIYGFNYFHPDSVEDNPHVPPVVLTGFRRNNRHETVSDSGTVLQKAISASDTLRLSFRESVITFEFAALDYSAPGKNRYAYRMAGYHDRWIESGTARSATYTNLPPGSYTFQVRGSNNDGVWNEEGTSLAVIVNAPWWRTRWAYSAYALLFAAGLYGLRRYETNRLYLEQRLEMEQLDAEQLRDLDRARNRFYTDISHEFRTPLTLTLGPMDDLLAGLHGPLPSPAKDQIRLARRSAGRVLDLINEILEVGRLEAGRTVLRARPVELGALVEGVAQAFVPLAERKRLTFEIHVPNEPLVLYGDPLHLEKIVSNLLSNAMKFSPDEGAVRVAVAGDARAARVSVRDSGPGIPSEELPRIFERFYRIERPAGAMRPGTGLGLALVRQLTELHGGSIDAESEEGFGSTFTVTLPRGSAHLAPEQISAGEHEEPWVPDAGRISIHGVDDAGTEGTDYGVDGDASGDGDREPGDDDDLTTVLVVEDNPEVRAYVRSHLTPAFRVLEAEDGEAALEMARRVLPDLVLSDVMMPGLDGFGLCRALKEDPETDFIPVILLTARAGREDRLTGLESRADDYLTKPFDVRELVARIENLIASRQRLAERLPVGTPATGPVLHASTIEVVPADQKFLEQVRTSIEDNLDDDGFNVARLAREVAHSRGHLHRRLRALLDESPSELIRRMRLERAAQLIDAGAGSIGEIAYSVGFKSVSHFSNRFVDQYGVRPSAYRLSRTTGQEDSDGPSRG